MSLSRRRFLNNSTITFFGFTFTSTIIGRSISLIVTPNEETILEKLKRAADIRKNNFNGMMQMMGGGMGSQQNLNGALQIYYEIIGLDVNEVRAYDGIRKILLQDQFRELEVLQLYLTNYNENTINPIFSERIAKEYMRLALGNKKFTQELNYPQDLLLVASSLFNQAKTYDPENEQLEIQYQKTQLKISIQATIIDARDNPELKIIKKINRQTFKNRFNHLNDGEILSLLQRLLDKKRNKDRDNHIRELYKIYINKLISIGEISKAIRQIEELYEFDKSDVHTLNLARKICNKFNNYAELENIERDNERIKNGFWSKIALFDILFKRFEVENIGGIPELTGLLEAAFLKIRSYQHKFEFHTRKVKILLSQNKFEECKSELIALGDNISGITSAHLINRFNFLCVKYFKSINEKGKAVMLINIALEQNGLPFEDEILKKIEKINYYRNDEKPIHRERLNYLRAQLF